MRKVQTKKGNARPKRGDNEGKGQGKKIGYDRHLPRLRHKNVPHYGKGESEGGVRILEER